MAIKIRRQSPRFDVLPRVGIIAPGFPPAELGGGPIRSLAALAKKALNTYSVAVLTADTDHGSDQPMNVAANRWTTFECIDVYYASTGRTSTYLRGLRALRRRKPDVIYLNSLFNFKMSIVPVLLSWLGWWGRGTRVIVAPRGELSPGALQYKPRKKTLFLAVARGVRLYRKVVWHATAAMERDEIAAVFPGVSDVLVQANDTELPDVADKPAFASERPLSLVFLSRIVPKKGLDVVLAALSDVEHEVSLDIYGAEEDVEYVKSCRALATNLPSHVSVTFHGPARAAEVRGVLAVYDAMVFPTHGENFGHVIAEALSVSLPVITTHMTPWTEVISQGGGVVVQGHGHAVWSEAISTMARTTAQERYQNRVDAGRAYDAWHRDTPQESLLDNYFKTLA